MDRNQALAAVDKAIETATGVALETLKAHRARMVQGWEAEDAKLAVKVAKRKKQALDWQRSIDFRPY
jgi:hypothetical protein